MRWLPIVGLIFSATVSAAPTNIASTSIAPTEEQDGIRVPLWLLLSLGFGTLVAVILIIFLIYKMIVARKANKAAAKAKTATASCRISDSNCSEKAKKSSGKSSKSTKSKKNLSGKSKLTKSSKSSRSLKSVGPSGRSRRAKMTTTKLVSVDHMKNMPKDSCENIKRSGSSESTSKLDVPPKRDEKSLIVEPVNSKEFRYYLNQLTDIAINYYEGVGELPVTVAGKPGFIFNAIDKNAPMKPQDFNGIIDDIRKLVIPGMVHWRHPQFHAYFSSGGCLADMLGEFVVGIFGAVGFSWDASPVITEMEQAMVNWLGRALGFSEDFLFGADPGTSTGGGNIYEGASEAVFTALMAARHAKICDILGSVERQNERGIHYDLDAMHELTRKFVVYTSKEAHSCVEKACKMSMVRCRAIVASEKNNFGITGEQLEQEIEKDMAENRVPLFCVATLGTTSTAASDDLPAIGPICEKYGIWLHIDAAYGGSFWIEPKHRTNCTGLDKARSIVVNPHKCLLHAPTTCFMWTKRKDLFMKMFNISPPYLKPVHENVMDLRDWSIKLSHKFKALRTYIIMNLYGVEGLRDFINRSVELSAYFETLVSAHPNIKIFTKRSFTLFTFQYYEPKMTFEDTNRATLALCRFMNQTRKVLFTHTKVGNYYLIRISVGLERQTKASIDESWAIMCDLIEEFQKKKDELMAGVSLQPEPKHLSNELAEMDALVGSIREIQSSTSSLETSSGTGTLTAQSPVMPSTTTITLASSTLTARQPLSPIMEVATLPQTSPSQTPENTPKK